MRATSINGQNCRLCISLIPTSELPMAHIITRHCGLGGGRPSVTYDSSHTIVHISTNPGVNMLWWQASFLMTWLESRGWA
ncbi:hypothetical protein Prudu_235S001500 [Prunus dulcis]|uniref:Uncharacterized protein n=1 Tax=Prunus dulcis TaxID=3755 RepID=A0A5H2XL56_PRUDU|nr:hypothetical protein Prudu_235S001500 [Prunus dulcis]